MGYEITKWIFAWNFLRQFILKVSNILKLYQIAFYVFSEIEGLQKELEELRNSINYKYLYIHILIKYVDNN